MRHRAQGIKSMFGLITEYRILDEMPGDAR